LSFYKLTLRYNGFGFQGWQKQSHTDQTIQGHLNKALEKISKSSEIHTIGSGRTDSGVHALAQIVRAEIPLEIDPIGLLKALNSHLPESIECIQCEKSSNEFNPVFDAKEKTYRYIFSLEGRRNPHFSNIVTFLDRDLDIEKMKLACKSYIGEHDFADFFTTGTEVKSTVRKIYSCELKKIENQNFFGDISKEYFQFEVVGSGFLKQMVRLMVGTLWNIGQGKVSIEELGDKLAKPNGEKLAPVAPPQGLYLHSVKY
jgi:tRNA pseudouridine38-40 synthase